MASGGDGAPNNRTSSGHGAWPSHHELSGCRLTPCHAGHVQLQPSTQDQAQTGPKALVNMRRSLKKKKISALVSIAVAQASHCSGFSHCGAQAPGRRLSSCGKWALLRHSMWDLPGPGIKPMSSALAGGFFTTEPPDKPALREFFWMNE